MNKDVAIAIRFSMRIKNFENKIAEPRNTWLEKRVEIFNRISYPCLDHHARNRARVFLFLANGDEWAYDMLSCAGKGNFYPVFTNDTVVDGSLRAILKSNFGRGHPLYITRMDSDDAIHVDFYENMDKSGIPDRFIMYRSGLYWDGNDLRQADYPANQFVTSYTNTVRFVSPLSFRHAMVQNYPHVIIDNHEPMWLSYVHGGNLYNTMREHWTRYSGDLGGFLLDTKQ